MRITTLVFAVVLAACPWSSFAQVAQPTNPQSLVVRALTLEEAWRLAEKANPALKTKQVQLAAAEGAHTDADALLFNNPQVSFDRTRRDVPQTGLSTERRTEWSAGLSQTLEIAGQRGHRRDVAEAALVALRLEIDGLRRQMRAEVAQQFYRVLALQQRADLEGQALKLFESTAAVIQKRRVAGEDTKLDANVALVEAERARNQLALAREQLLDARSELAAILQLPPEHVPETSGDLAGKLAAAAYPLGELLAGAEAQPKLQALAARENSARAKLSLERSSRYPDVTLGLNVGREGPGDARERLTTFSVSVPLPLFKRNATGLGQATSELAQAEIERQTVNRDVRAQVRALSAKLESLRTRVRRLQELVLPALADNQRLSTKSQRAGQIGLLELIVVSRQTLDARRDLIDALTDFQTTRLSLELAAGWSPEGIKP